MQRQMSKIWEKIDKKMLLTVLIIITSFMATYLLPYAIEFKEDITFSNSIIAIVVFASFVYIQKKSFTKENVSKIKNISLLSIIFSSFLVFGNKIDKYSQIDFKDIKVYLAILSISFIINAILVQVYKFIEKFEEREEKETKPRLTGKKRYLAIFLIILICWIPVFLAVYPGYFCYDVYSEYNQYKINYITAWHTVIHTWILGFTIDTLHNLTGDINIAIAIYTIIQMLIISAIFTYCIYFLEKFKTSKIISRISILYYALFPVIVMYAICTTKDSIFTAIMLFSIVISIEALLDKERFMKSKLLQARFIIVTFLAIIMRNNAIYAYIPFLILFAILLRKKEILISFTIIAILYAIYVGPIYDIVGVRSRYKKQTEAFSVPLQQIARVYNYNYEDLTDDEIEKILLYTQNEMVESIQNCTAEEKLKKYDPKLSDYIKDFAEIDRIGYKEFFKLWFEIGLRNPGIYVESFLENTLAFWYPDTIIDAYNSKYETDTSYFLAICELPRMAR